MKGVWAVLLAAYITGCSPESKTADTSGPYDDSPYSCNADLEDVDLEMRGSDLDTVFIGCTPSEEFLEKIGLTMSPGISAGYGFKVGKTLQFLISGQDCFDQRKTILLRMPYKVAETGKADCRKTELIREKESVFRVEDYIIEDNPYVILEHNDDGSQVKLWSFSIKRTQTLIKQDGGDKYSLQKADWDIISVRDDRSLILDYLKGGCRTGLVIRDSEIFGKKVGVTYPLGNLSHSTLVIIKKEEGELLKIVYPLQMMLFVEAKAVGSDGKIKTDTCAYNDFVPEKKEFHFILKKGDQVKTRFIIRKNKYSCIAPTEEMTCFIKKENVRWPVR